MTIPGNESTTYWCTLLKGPELKQKHHLTKVLDHLSAGKVWESCLKDQGGKRRKKIKKLKKEMNSSLVESLSHSRSLLSSAASSVFVVATTGDQALITYNSLEVTHQKCLQNKPLFQCGSSI